ncbi:hypothetical protein BJ165DRAFT_152282 [Panaeolus papilionaceus]|nr:hypothetical protein BJ165DRAFT_152282 [Panaeolus papilionaceus]
MAYRGGGWNQGGGGWWGGGANPGTYSTPAPGPSPTASPNPPPAPPSHSPSPPPPPSPRTGSNPGPTVNPNPGPNPNPSPNTAGQNNDGGDDDNNKQNGSLPTNPILSSVLSANPSLTQTPTRTTLTLDGSTVVVQVVAQTADNLSTIYVTSTLPDPQQAGQGSSQTPIPATAGDTSSEKRGLRPGTIVGVLLGGVLAALLASWVVWCLWKRRNRKTNVDPYPPQEPEPEIYTPSFTSPSSLPSSDSNLSSPAYSTINNDVLMTSSPLRQEKGQIHDTIISVGQPQRPALPQLVIPSPTISHMRALSMSSYRTDVTGPPQYTSLFANQPTPEFRLSQLVSPFSPPQDMEPAMFSSWTRRSAVYDVEQGSHGGPAKF